MPSLEKKRRAYLPEPEPFRNAKRSGHLRKNKWTQASKRYRKDNPVCEVSAHYGITAPAEHVDHIIRPSHGGAIYDRRNLMSITADLHNWKTGKEQHSPILVDWELNERGYKVPTNRAQVFEMFREKMEK